MIRRTGLGCACQDPPRTRSPAMGGILSTLLDVGGSFVGDPGLGNQVAATSPAAFGPITQTPAEIATTILPNVQPALANVAGIDTKSITTQSQQVANSVLPQTVAALTAAGYTFAPGTYGAALQSPDTSALDAFGGQYAGWVLIGGLGLAALLLLKEL
jgi:hypothetical protein